MKTRSVTIFSGHRFDVPQCIQLIDARGTRGWQVRYQGTKLFSDGTADGSGAEAALRRATKELLARIAQHPAPAGLRSKPSAGKASSLPVGISGPVLTGRTAGRSLAARLQVTLPRFGQQPKVASVHIGTKATYSEDRFTAALQRAIEMRSAAEQQYEADATKDRRNIAKQLRKAMRPSVVAS